MANVKIYKRPPHFCASAYRFRDIDILNVWPSMVTEYNFRNIVIRWQIWKSTKAIPYIFALSLTISDINVSNLLPFKSMSRSWSTIFATTPFDCQCQILHMAFLTFLIFTKVRPVLTKITDTDRHRCTQKRPNP